MAKSKVIISKIALAIRCARPFARLGLVIVLMFSQSSVASNVENSALHLSLSEFTALAAELSVKATVFRDVWQADGDAEFFGGTTRDYLYWLVRELQLPSRRATLKKIKLLREKDLIDVREFITAESDIDIVTDKKPLPLQAADYGVRKFDVVAKARFVIGTPENLTEINQGFIPIEKIRLGRRGFISSSQFGDGIREIYQGRPTVVFASKEQFETTHYAIKKLNHPVLLALRYLRLLALNYSNHQGKSYPDGKILLDIDVTSANRTREVIAASLGADLPLQSYLNGHAFRTWVNGTIKKAFESFASPTAAKMLFESFGADKLIALYNLNPINQYLFAKKYDLAKIESNLADHGLQQDDVFIRAEDFYGAELLGYHGVESKESLRSLVFEGVYQTVSGRGPEHRHPGGHGFYTVANNTLGAISRFTSRRSNPDLVVQVKVSAQSRVIDLRKTKMKILSEKLSPDEIADLFGGDIVVREYPGIGAEGVIKNSQVIESITSEVASLKPFPEIVNSMASVTSTSEMAELLKTARFNELLDHESKVLLDRVYASPALTALLEETARNAASDDELRAAFVRIVFAALRDKPDLLYEFGKKISHLTPQMTFDQWIEAVRTKAYDRPRDVTSGEYELYNNYLIAAVVPTLKQLPAEKTKPLLDATHAVLNEVGSEYRRVLESVGGTPVRGYNHGDEASKGVQLRFWDTVFTEVVVPLLKSGGAGREIGLQLAESIVGRNLMQERLLASVSLYAVTTQDHEFIHRLNILAATASSGLMPTKWIEKFADFPTDLRVRSFADFVETVEFLDIPNRREGFTKRFVLTYEYEYRKLPETDISKIVEVLRSRSKEARGKKNKRRQKALEQAIAILEPAPLQPPAQEAIPNVIQAHQAAEIPAQLLSALMADAAAGRGDIANSVQAGLLDLLDHNIYDESVMALSRTGQAPVFAGRDAELEQLTQAMRRIDKAHALLTGKAGVGKTTLVKMLQVGWLSRQIPYPGQHEGQGIPIILELSILDVTNQNDPSAIRKRINAARTLAKLLNRHVILFVDEAHTSTKLTRNAIKSFLSESFDGDNLVHMIWATTSNEAREFLEDSAFSRRWIEINLREFSDSETIAAIKKSFLPRWQLKHQAQGLALADISDEAYSFALKYASYEQPHAGNPTAVKELLEGAIGKRLRELELLTEEGHKLTAADRAFILRPEDIRNYLKFQLGYKLIPGDADFEPVFAEIWRRFEQDYVGNEGVKLREKELLRNFFGSLHKSKMSAKLLFGPPGGGKSYLPEMVAKHFFGNEPLVINGGEYSGGGLVLNKLIGSPPGTVGSEEQRSVLTKFIKDNPRGGIIVFEEADLLHQDVLNFLVNMISKKEFDDGLGKKWNMERYIIYLNSNVGQDLMIANNGNGEQMSWADYEIRKKAMTAPLFIDGRNIDVVRPEKLQTVFEQFVAKVSAASHPNADSSIAAQDGEKLKRRIEPYYVFPPTLEELLAAALKMRDRFVKNAKDENGVEFSISDELVEAILDLKSFRFELGHGFVAIQLEARLFDRLKQYLTETNKKFSVTLGRQSVKFGQKEIEGPSLVVSGLHGQNTEHALGISLPPSQNPWFSNEEIRRRISNFRKEMASRIMGQDRQVADLHAMLKKKSIDWSKRIVMTQLGTSGNGKTEFGYAVAEVLFGSRQAARKISGLRSWGDLNDFLRSNTGFSGSKDQTDFEKWFKSRRTAGGGVIILDELLSISGLKREEISERLSVINKLYDLFDEGTLRIGSTNEDARAFIILVTGNFLQELFAQVDDSPESERLVARILQGTTSSDLERMLTDAGIDAPKVARLGKLYLNGPLTTPDTRAVGLKDLSRTIRGVTSELSHLYSIDVDVDPTIIDEIISRVTTVKLGMRQVNRAIETVIGEPVSGILADLIGTEKITAKLIDGKIIWRADGQEVRLVEGTWRSKSDIEADDKPGESPQLADVTIEPKIILSPLQFHISAVHEVFGHFMVGFLINGQNQTESISLTPAGDNLAKVSLKSKLKSYEAMTLLTWLKELVIFEAGHRAVFLEGIAASGGGSSNRRTANEPGSDDMLRVEDALDAILSNQIFNDFREFGNSRDNADFKRFMREVAKQIADELIRFGKSTGVFNDIFNQTLRDRFITDEVLESLLEKSQAFRLVGDPNLLFADYLQRAVKSVLKKQKSDSANSKMAEKLERLSVELLRKIHDEIIARAKFNGATDPTEQLATLTSNCESILAQGGDAL